MKRISTAAVAAATALAITAGPALAEDATTTQTATVTATPTEEPTTAATETSEPTAEAPAGTEGTETTQPTTPNKPAPQPNNGGSKSSGSSNGHIVGFVSGTLAAVLTTTLIVASDPTGANKIIDMVNAQFHLGIPHLNIPKVF